ncbi:MAG: hypothetical protein KDA92_18655 [Planctomycetales bacterium]|nr:hypothetical protein [Planctomycetales bacterium]MCA9169165.1 hypothetical protein [Planctomycetales bacterium]
MQNASGPVPAARSFADVCNLESLFRNKLLIVAVWLSVLAATMAFLFVRQRSYESQARMFVRLGRESVTVDPIASATGHVISPSDSQQREIQSVLDILQSRGLIEGVVDRLGPEGLSAVESDGEPQSPLAQWASDMGGRIGDALASFREALVPLKLADPKSPRSESIKEVEEALKVGAEDESNVVFLSVQAESPELAARIAEEVLNVFQDMHLWAHRAPGSLSFFREQTAIVKAELDDAMNKLRDEKNAAGLVSIESQKQVLADRLKEVQVAALQSLSEHEASSARWQNMTEALDSIPERVISHEVTGVTNTSRDGMRGPLYAVELRKAELASTLSEDHPLVRKAEEQIRQAKSVYEEETVEPQITTSLNRAHEEIQLAQYLEKANIASSAARMTELDEQRTQIEEEIRNLNAREVALIDLQRHVDVLDAKYRRYAESLEQARVDEALERDRLSSVNIIQAPTLNDDPVDFSNSLIALGGLIASVFAAIGAALGIEFLRHDIRSKTDVERQLNLPVLADVPFSRRQRVRLS